MNIKETIDAAIAQQGEILCCTTSFFKELGDAPTDDLKAIFGSKLGSNIQKLCSVINLTHPDLDNILKPHFQNTILQALQVSAFIRKNGLNLICLDKCLRSEIKENEDQLTSLRMQARLLQRGERDAVRKLKTSQAVELNNAYKKGLIVWDGLVKDFSFYVRNNNSYQDEIIKYYKQAEKLKTLGCVAMYDEMMKTIESFKVSHGDTHYGFHKITMTFAALILAKMIGYFWEGSKLEAAAASLIDYQLPANGKFYTYCPMAYPADQINLSDRFKKTIEYLDNFPEASNNPIFDYYIVLIPAFVPMPRLEFHIDLVKKNLMPSVLLGEKDGKCYFISMDYK